MTRPWTFSLGLLLLPLSAARAEGRRAELERGKSLYRKLEFEQCIAALKRAERTVTAGSDLIDLELYLGLCEAGVNHTREAAAHFQTALELDSAVELPARSSPKVVALFRLLKEQVAPRPVRPPVAAAPPPVAQPSLAPSAPTREPPPAWAQPARPTSAEARAEVRRPPVPAWVGWALGATAVAGATGFTVFGLQASSQASQANAPGTYADDAARLGRSARQDAVLANVGLGVGAAALSGLAVVLVLNLGRAGQSP